MATSELARPRAGSTADAWSVDAGRFKLSQVLSVLASLRLTVVLFALSLFLVFVGTLAQKDHDVWFVVDHAYFRVWVAHVEWRTFERLVQMFAPVHWNLTGGFLFPGGNVIGLALLANLLAAPCGAIQSGGERPPARGRFGGDRSWRSGHRAGDPERHERHARQRAFVGVLQRLVARRCAWRWPGWHWSALTCW